MGESKAPAKETEAHSAEGIPTQAPKNLIVLNANDSRSTVQLRWDPSSIKSLNGFPKEYRIYLWTSHNPTPQVLPIAYPKNKVRLNKLGPATLYFAHIALHNVNYQGPFSNIVQFKAFDDKFQSFEAFPFGSTAFLLRWVPPLHLLEYIDGYNVYWEDIEQELCFERKIYGNSIQQIKLSQLRPNTKYQVSIAYVTDTGEGKRYSIEAKTNPMNNVPPDPPTFALKLLNLNEKYGKIQVDWIPKIDGVPGVDFFVKYHLKGQQKWYRSIDVVNGFTIFFGELPLNKTYEFIVVSVDGEYTAESEPQEIQTKKIDLKVWTSPEIAVERKKLDLNCEIPNDQLTTVFQVRWFYNGVEIYSNENRKCHSNGILQMNEIYRDDSGEYICRVGQLYEGRIFLVVRKRTEIRNLHENLHVRFGNTIVLPCNVNTDPHTKVNVTWKRYGEEIDFQNEHRFKQFSNRALIISNTTQMDSGLYICKAETDYDHSTAFIELIVKVVPTMPKMYRYECLENDEIVNTEWQTPNWSSIPIDFFTIEWNTLFEPNHWTTHNQQIKIEAYLKYQFSLTPWANYSFRIIAHNEIGASPPSEPTEICSSKPSRQPNKNPENVKGEGNEPTKLVISWNVMPQLEHYGPGFYYRIYWKRDIPNEEWNIKSVINWRQNNIVFKDQPTFQRYCIKIEAHNIIGKAITKADEVIGYSGEGTPNEAPTNLSATIKNYTSVVLSWNAVSRESLNGHFGGYDIQISNNDISSVPRKLHINDNSTEVIISRLRAGVVYYICMFARNSIDLSPASELIEVKIPTGMIVQSFQAFALGTSALLLRWKPPYDSNDQLTGYNIYYEEINGTDEYERKEINDSHANQTKLIDLKPSAKYRVVISTITEGGERESYDIEAETKSKNFTKLDSPSFTWEFSSLEYESGTVRVTWTPDVDGNPGTNFFVKYRIKDKGQWIKTKLITDEIFVDIGEILSNETYEIAVV